jgi:hypothetical protein
MQNLVNHFLAALFLEASLDLISTLDKAIIKLSKFPINEISNITINVIKRS